MIYAIGDLHLGFYKGKTMEPFGIHWEKHYEKIRNSWLENIKEDDWVLIAGDTSWAISLEEAEPDFKFLSELPGRKVLIKGNHDYWWNSLSVLRNKYKDNDIFFIQNDSVIIDNITICGTRGWITPGEALFTPEDEKIYKREVNRLRLSLETASNNNEIWVLMHFPPMTDINKASEFIKLFEEYNVKRVIYGHIHGKENFPLAPVGIKNEIEYKLVSCDYIDFRPVRLSVDK